jgi:hypothetical protein
VESDTLFLPLALVCLVALMDHLDRGDPRDVRDAAIAAAAAALARYTGVALVAIGTLGRGVRTGATARVARAALRRHVAAAAVAMGAAQRADRGHAVRPARARRGGNVFGNVGAAGDDRGLTVSRRCACWSRRRSRVVALALAALALAGATYVRAARRGDRAPRCSSSGSPWATRRSSC